MKKFNLHSLNVITSIIQQITTLVVGIIIPKIVLSYFGSEVNGLISSISQFLSYITLIEGGVSSVVVASFYKPLHSNDSQKISTILKTSENFYRKIAIVYVVYSLAVGLLYPLMNNTEFSYGYILALTIILSVGLLIQYMTALPMRNLLNADNKVFVVSLAQIFVSAASLVLIYLSVFIYPSVHILKLMGGIVYLIQPVFYKAYIKKHYNIDKNAGIDKDLLKSRWDGFAINIAAFIHYSTDIVILTVFTNLSVVSVYSVYALVITGLRGVITAISNAVAPTIGLAYASEDKEDLCRKMRIYEMVMNLIVISLFVTAALLITPFVQIYTKGIDDADYIQTLFGYLILASEALYLIKFPHQTLAYSANKFKEISMPCFVEAGINIVVSLVLVKFLGLNGVAIGTICAMAYRMIFQLYFTKQIVPEYSVIKSVLNQLVLLVPSAIGFAICYFLIPGCDGSVLSWIWHGGVYFAIIAVLTFGAAAIFEKNDFKNTVKFFIR